MKVKLNLDKESIKTFLLEHTEKLVFGAVIACFVLLVYQAIGRDTFDRTPEQLRDAARIANEHIERTDPPLEDSEFTRIYEPKVAGWRDNPIQVAPYEHTRRWDPAVFDPQGPRADPQLLAVEELRGSGGSGPFSMKDDGIVQTRGQRWIVVTGLVMYDRQVEEFQRCFRDAEFQQKSPKDELTYVGFEVERATVDGLEAGEALKWNKTIQFSRSIGEAELAKWAQASSDVVAAEFLEESLTFPLGPLLGRSWGPEATHPGISLENALPEEMPEEMPENLPGDDDDDVFDPFGMAAVAAPAMLIHAMAGDPGAPTGLRLFRFFDFDVEPGKRYRYRVRLVVRNSNFKVPVRFLVNPASTNDRYVKSDFSVPTEAISVPHDSRVYAVAVKPPIRIKDNPSGTVRIQSFVFDTGKTVSKEFTVFLGQVMNFYGVTTTTRPPPAAGNDFPAAGGRAAATVSAPVDYVTDALALDLRGGERLYATSSLAAPGEILVLDRTGNLVWHNEFEDTEAYEASITSEAEPNELQPVNRPADVFDPDADDDFDLDG